MNEDQHTQHETITPGVEVGRRAEKRSWRFPFGVPEGDKDRWSKTKTPMTICSSAACGVRVRWLLLLVPRTGITVWVTKT